MKREARLYQTICGALAVPLSRSLAQRLRLLDPAEDPRRLHVYSCIDPVKPGSPENLICPRFKIDVTTLTKAGRYELRDELGRGAMGVVYQAHDPVIGREVAVKTMHLSEAGTEMSREELVGRFQTEARAAGLLAHPNIVVIYDAGAEGNLFYITMEMVLGRSLQSLMDARQLFPLPRVMKLMEQICSALDFAHHHNVVHRDIKPANLLLTEDDTVKITDFGTAKILQFGTAQTSHVMGTPSYMSPEQVKGKPVDGRSDIFSLGVVLYELMTGEKPFPGQNITTVIYKIINEEPIPPRSLDASIHPGLSAVITRALSKDPATRFQSCRDLLDGLKNYREIVTPEATVRMAPVRETPPVEGNRANATPRRLASAPLITRPNSPEASVKLFPANPWPEEKPSRQRGSLLLSVILLGIIGYAGYRIYPQMLDLWQRAHQTVEENKSISSTPPATPVASAATAAPAINSSSSPEEKPEIVPSPAPAAPSHAPSHAPKAAPIASENAAPPLAPQLVAHLPAEKANAPIVLTSTEGNEKSAENSADPQKTTPGAQLSPAAMFETKLRARLESLQIAGKVKTQVTANNLTLTGQLNPIEHRRLLNQLHFVPAGVRIIDDIGFSDTLKETPAPASSGWVWVRSQPRGAEILLDDADTGLRTPARIELQQGQHAIRMTLGGYAERLRTVEVQPGQTMQITESLEKQ
jgi:eukaryotic-like serine/threonine-protein kinase